MNDFDIGLDRFLKKSELEYRAKNLSNGSCVDWLAPYCDSTENIARFLRELGFHIAEIVDEQGSSHKEDLRWVVTTSGVIVYVNAEGLNGFVAQAYDRRKRGCV